MEKNKFTEGELEKTQPDLDHNFPSPKTNSGIMNAHHNDPYNFIDDPEDFPVSHLTPT